MAVNTENSFAVCEQDWMEDSGLGSSCEATIITNPQQEGGSKQMGNLMEENPQIDVIVHVNSQLHNNTEDLQDGALDTPDAVVISLPAHENTPETVPSPELVARPSNHDKAVGIAKNVNPAYWPQSADLQATIEELKEPTDLPDDECSCCLGCSIPCTYKDETYELGYNCTKQKCFVLCKGAKSVLQYWTDGFTPRWKLVLMFAKILIYGVLAMVAVAKFSINYLQGENIKFDSINFACTLCGSMVSLAYTIVFIIRRRREVRIILVEVCTWIALAVYKCCCCCCTIRPLEDLKRCEESKLKPGKAEKYVDEMKTFKPSQNCCQQCTALLGNISEVLLTIADDVFLSIVFIISLYNFMGKQEFTIFYGNVKKAHICGFVLLVLSALKLIIFVHGLRVYSIAANVRALDKKVERDSEVMEVELPNKYLRYFLSFQWRLVFHALLSSTFQLYGIFALSWKIIQDSCSLVEAPSLAAAAGSTGAPFTCNFPSVNGFTVYNILYIVIVPPLLGYTSFFVCNTPWLVEYMQTITMWTYLQIEYTTGHRVRKDRIGGLSDIGRYGVNAQLCRVNERDAYTSPVMQLLRIFCGDMLCDVSTEELRTVGANAERVRRDILSDHDHDALNFGTNCVSRAFMMLGQVLFFTPAAIIGALQVVLFIIHLSFLGCCFTNDVHAVLSPSVLDDFKILFTPLIFLFLVTSIPGPWMGLFWLFIVITIILIVATIVAFVLALVAVVVLGIQWLACILCMVCMDKLGFCE